MTSGKKNGDLLTALYTIYSTYALASEGEFDTNSAVDNDYNANVAGLRETHTNGDVLHVAGKYTIDRTNAECFIK